MTEPRVPVVLMLSPALARHVAGSLRLARRMLAKDWQLPPEGADELERMLTAAARSGQERSSVAGTAEPGDPDAMKLLLTYDDAEGLTSLSARTLRRAVADGSLRAVRAGSAVRFHRADLEAWIETRRGAA